MNTPLVTAQGPVVVPSSTSPRPNARIFEDLERFGDRVAIITEDDHKVTYTDLLSRGEALTHELAGSRRLVMIELATALDPIAAYVAAIRAGHVIIIAGEGGSSATSRMAEVFRPEFVFARSGDTRSWQRRSAEPHELHPELAVLLSTSGSTGSPKLVRLSHGALIANSRAIIEYLDYQPGETAFLALPLYFSYGMSILHSQLQSGGTLVLNSLSVTDPEVWRRFDRHAATSLTGVPHTYELLEQTDFFNVAHPRLRYLACGGGKLAPHKVETFARHAQASGHRFYVTYGQTEGGPRMAYLPPEDAVAYPDCIGRAIPGGTFRLDNVSTEGVGELVFVGPSVMMGYALSPADLSRGPEIAELRTGDLAALNDAGYYRIVGRASRFSKIFGVRIGFDDVERLIADGGDEGAVCGDDEGLVVATPRRGRAEAIKDRLAAHLKIPASRIFVAEVDAIPRHASGKINYPVILKLRPARDETIPTSLRREMAEILGTGPIGPDDTFVGLGGDSLSYVQAAVLLERMLGHTPADWENTPFGVLEQAVQKRGPSAMFSLESGVVVRALSIVLVVVNHVMQLGLGGVATTLLMVAGINFSRFQVPRLVSGGSGELLRSVAVRVLLPYMIVIAIYTAAIGEVFWPQFLLFSNFTQGFFVEGVQRFTVYWFIEAYIGLMVAASLLFLIPSVRAAMRARQQTMALLGFVTAGAVALVGRSFPDVPAFYIHTPISLAYVFLFGWLIELARRPIERVGLAVAGAVLFYLLPIDAGNLSYLVICAALAILLFVRRLPVGRVFGQLLSVLAAASFHIYIFHGFVIHAVEDLGLVIGPEISPIEAPGVVTAGVALGVACWWGIERMYGWLPAAFQRASRGGVVGPHAARTGAAAESASTDPRPTSTGRVLTRPRLLVYGPSFRRLLPDLTDDVDVVVMEEDGTLVHNGQCISAQQAQPEIAWVSQDLFGTSLARDYWAVLLASGALAWTHSDAAGTDGPIYDRVMATGARLTTNDSQATGISEYVMGEVLCCFQRVAERRQAQTERRWQSVGFREIAGSRWLIVGFGAIGQAVAVRARAFGAHVTGVRRNATPHEAADQVITLAELDHVLPAADVVVLSVPLTPATQRLADGTFFSRMKKEAVLVNVGRGGLVDEAALVNALESGAPGHAILDVFDVEPLPADSPLWTHELVVVTAHAAAMGSGRVARSDALFLDNLSRFVRGQALRNQVEGREDRLSGHSTQSSSSGF